jgi:hypothetical protein
MGRRRAWSLDDDERLRQLAAAGYSRHAIARKLERRDSSVDVRAREISVPIKARRRPHTQRPQGNVNRASLHWSPADAATDNNTPLWSPDVSCRADRIALIACIDSLQRELERVDALARELARLEGGMGDDRPARL